MFLQFITEPAIGRKERRVIRSHVMRGKNAGKPRPPRTKLVHRNVQIPLASPSHAELEELMMLDEPTQNELEKLVKLDARHTLALKRILWNEFKLVSFSRHLSPEATTFAYYSLWVISKILYPPEFCLEVNLSTCAWFTYVLEDEAYLHCLLAISNSFTAEFGGPRHNTPGALKHITEAYRLVGERLASAEACSDQAIAVVTILAIYQRMQHQQTTGLVHFDGLRRMIKMRGGLKQLAKENRTVAQKPWRLALEFALQDGSTPGFSLADISVSTCTALSSTAPIACMEISDIHQELRSFLSSAHVFTSRLNDIASTPGTQSKLDPHDYFDAVCVRLHKLLTYAPLEERYRQALTPLEDVLHLSLVAIMTTLMPEYGHNQARYDLLVCRIQRALQRYATMADSRPNIVLWTLFVAYATVLGKDDAPWLVPMARTFSDKLSIRTWDKIHELVESLAWISAFYDEPGMKFWSMMHGVQEIREAKAQTKWCHLREV